MAEEMAYVSQQLRNHFSSREKVVLNLIREADLKYDCVGVFGSYARNDFTTESDIDFCIITNEKPPRTVSGSLREEAELLGADIIFVPPEYFASSESEFAKQLRRDFRRVL